MSLKLVWRVPPPRIGLAWRKLVEPPALVPQRDTGEGLAGGASLIGRRGPPGPPGSGASVQINQTTPAGTWILSHGFGRRPLVQVFFANGEQTITDVTATDTQVTVVFATPQAGYVLLS